LGSAGEALFFGLLFVLGSISLATLVSTELVNPEAARFRPGFGFWLMVIVLSSFVLIGGSGVLYTVIQLGASVERRSAMVRRAAGIDLIRDSLRSDKDYPTIPRDAHLTNSPGVTLAFRLPVVPSSTWRLWLATLFCLVCTAVTSILLIVAVKSYVGGAPEWFLTVFLVPLVVINTWAIFSFVRELWQHTRVGPACVEISDHPLRPGREYAIFLSLAGRLAMQSLEMSLVCAEEATYHQGTDIRRETRVVHRHKVFTQESFVIEPGSPFEQQAALFVPDHAMHSFQSGYNAVHWKLVVEGQPTSGPAFVRSFPVIVYPSSMG
jgi:hypothetical protein